MKYKLKVFTILPLLLIASIIIFAPRASALTISDILNQPKVLGDSTSNIYPYPTASLVKEGSAIYFISGTTKVPFTNYKAFTGLGYSLKNVVSGDLSSYSSSQSYVIGTANGRHPWGSWLSYKGVVYYLSQDGMIGVPSSAIFLSNGGQWKFVVAANKYDVAILKANPALPLLASSDSRVISQTVLQFSGPSSTTPPAPASPTPAPTPSAATTTPATTTVVSFDPVLYVPANIYASSSASFTAPSADPNTPLVYNFNWDDGSQPNSLSISTATHTYYIAGVYMLNISVTDSLTNTYATTVPITVTVPPNQSPSVPSISVPSGIVVGAEATVTANSHDPNSLPIFYDFSWGDGSPDTIAPGNSATHTYTSSDSYGVKVTVANTAGFSSSASAYLYIAP